MFPHCYCESKRLKAIEANCNNNNTMGVYANLSFILPLTAALFNPLPYYHLIFCFSYSCLSLIFPLILFSTLSAISITVRKAFSWSFFIFPFSLPALCFRIFLCKHVCLHQDSCVSHLFFHVITSFFLLCCVISTTSLNTSMKNLIFYCL